MNQRLDESGDSITTLNPELYPVMESIRKPEIRATTVFDGSYQVPICRCYQGRGGHRTLNLNIRLSRFLLSQA